MQKQLKVQLGECTNLLYGYSSNWLSNESGNSGLFPTEKKALIPKPILPPETPISEWDFPIVTLHDDSISLLNELFPYKVNNPIDCVEPTLPAGVLLLSNSPSEQTVLKLGDTLGIDLQAQDCSFVLVQIKRHEGEVEHPSYNNGVFTFPNLANIPPDFGVTRQFSEEAAGLKKRTKGAIHNTQIINEIDISTANKYLDFYKNQGTHFVSKVKLGDVIFQIFSIPKARYKRIQQELSNIPKPLSGWDATYFVQYTSAYREGNYGFVKQYGKLLSFSQSSQLVEDIKNNKWLESNHSFVNNIFAPYANNSAYPYYDLFDVYKDTCEIEIEMTSLSLFIEHSRRQVWQRILSAGVIHKYRQTIKPNFIPHENSNLSKELNNGDIPGFLSTIATPVINSYKACIDIADMHFLEVNQVNQFTLFSNYLHNSGKKFIQIPGKDVVIAVQRISLENTDSVTVLELSDDGYNSLTFKTKDFFGALQIQNRSGNSYTTLVDGLKYEFTSGSTYIKVTEDVRSVPDEKLLLRLAPNLKFSYVFAETGISTFGSSKDKLTLTDFLRQSAAWITEIIPSSYHDKDLLDLRVGALNVAYLGPNSKNGAFVPLLLPKEYDNLLKTILDYAEQIDKEMFRFKEEVVRRKNEELLISVGTNLNQNIIQTGQLLNGYVGSVLAQQENLNKYYDTIINEKKADKVTQNNLVTNLSNELAYQKSEIGIAISNYKQAIKDQNALKKIKFALDIAGSLFDLGSAVVAPVGSGFAALANLVKKLIDVSEKFVELYEKVETSVTNLLSTQDSFNDIQTQISANLGWDELSIEFKKILSEVPSEGFESQKSDLTAAFERYVLKGKAYVTALTGLQKLGSEIYDHQRQQKLAKEQIVLLNNLTSNLTTSPAQISGTEPLNIDLIGLTGVLNMLQTQVMGILAKTFALKDQSLQYHYLQEATFITSFDILSIRKALFQQALNTKSAKELLAANVPTTVRETISFEIPTEYLLNGKAYRFNLATNNPNFLEYARVRVKSVVAKINSGIASSDTGSYHVKLNFLGNSFVDRGLQKNILLFNTPDRQGVYKYDIKGNNPLFTDDGNGWSKDVNAITPFSDWEISLPITPILNQGLKFNSLTTAISIDFELDVRILSTLKSRADIKPSLSSLLAKMNTKTCLNNWDVVFNMTLSSVNKVLKKQYTDLMGNKSGEIEVETSKLLQMPFPDTLVHKENIITKLSYGYPSLAFSGSQECTLEFKILSASRRSTFYLKGPSPKSNFSVDAFIDYIINMLKLYRVTDYKCKKTDDGKFAEFTYKLPEVPTLNVRSMATLKSTIPLSMKVTGNVTNPASNAEKVDIVLNLADGVFSTTGIDFIESSFEDDIALSNAIRAFFLSPSNNVSFVINSIDKSRLGKIEDLKPNKFRINTYTPNNLDPVLQLFIQTSGRGFPDHNQANLNSDLGYPIPEGHECCLMISSEIFYKSVIPSTMMNGWVFEGTPPKKSTDSWSGKFSNAQVKTTLDLSSLTHGGQDINSTSWWRYSYSPKTNPTIWSLNGMTIKPKIISETTPSLDLNYTEGSKVTFEYIQQKDGSNNGLAGNYPINETKYLSTDIQLTVSAHIPLKTTGTEFEQTVRIDASNTNVAVSGRTSGGGPSGTQDIEAKLNEVLIKQVPPLIKAQLDVNFGDISVFALKNLLFPAKTYIKMTEAYAPGDLLILGQFSNVTPPSNDSDGVEFCFETVDE